MTTLHFAKEIEEEIDEIARELGFSSEGQSSEAKVRFINEKLSAFGFRKQALEHIEGYVDLLQKRTRYPDMLRLAVWTYLLIDEFRRTHTIDLTCHLSSRSIAETGPPRTEALERWVERLRRLEMGLRTMSDNPGELRSRIIGFPQKYVKDWRTWCFAIEQNGIHSIESAEGLVSVLQKFQAARGVKNRKVQSPREVKRLLETESVAQAIEVLTRLDLRTFHDQTTEQERAVRCLWGCFREGLFQGGQAGGVGITKAIMLVTKGNMGPALDSVVRKTIKCGRILRADDLIAVYREVARWVVELEKRHNMRLERDLVPQNWQPLNIGRVVDMIFGPRQARPTEPLRMRPDGGSSPMQQDKEPTKDSATFWEALRALRIRKVIPRLWRVRDIRPHLIRQFSANTIKTVPPNQSISKDGSVKGNYVVNGASPMAYRVERGLYELIDDPAVRTEHAR